MNDVLEKIAVKLGMLSGENFCFYSIPANAYTIPYMQTMKESPENLIRYRYMLTTVNMFYTDIIDRAENALINIFDVDANTQNERDMALKYFLCKKMDFLFAIMNKQDCNFRHQFGFQLVYKNVATNAKEYFQIKKSCPLKFVDKNPFFSCIKNPFNIKIFDIAFDETELSMKISSKNW